MSVVLWLLTVQGAIGAFDTLYYHEWRAHLPALGPAARSELRLHGARDFLYALIFATLPDLAWHGVFALALAAVLVTEIGITLADFIVEDRVRRPIGGVYPGERATHAVMGILYGAMLGHLAPALLTWSALPTGLVHAPVAVSETHRWLLRAMAAGVLVSGIRDLCAAAGIRGSAWPWTSRVLRTPDPA